ncbi:MAG TPA: hypothetical protein VGO96_17220 [Pyrinomonadaceae bacterium]|nr:hypothetical protein [Pyrinomonadaceae bacterium]
MKKRASLIIKVSVLVCLCAVAFIIDGVAQKSKPQPKQEWTPQIPKSWDDKELAALELPLANPKYTPKHVSAEFYYGIPALPIYKTYPIYAPGKEPPGYMEWLAKQEPEIAFDASKLKTQEDWIKAGELIFNAPIFFNGLNQPTDVRDPQWYERSGMPVAKDGTMPYNVYSIREKGVIEIGEFSCATCHTRVMPDGSIIKGAQGNYPLGRLDELDARKHVGRASQRQYKSTARGAFVLGYYTPWVQPDELEQFDKMTLKQFAEIMGALVPGVQVRPGVSLTYPVQVPDLIGVKDRRYLDRTGLHQHRSIADMMRYAALNQGASFLAKYLDFIPRGELTDPKKIRPRYSDEQLYALSLYIYSLKPPPNPNKFDALAARGKKVFEAEGCNVCHTPPLYTSNKLSPVEGFKVPDEHRGQFSILPVSVGTDPGLALYSRRATGYYKVPSLKGVWYRGPFEHSGSVATLEDWFDPRRLRDDYVPTGFRGAGVEKRAVKGHPFGLELKEPERKALIAFLKTL